MSPQRNNKSFLFVAAIFNRYFYYWHNLGCQLYKKVSDIDQPTGVKPNKIAV